MTPKNFGKLPSNFNSYGRVEITLYTWEMHTGANHPEWGRRKKPRFNWPRHKRKVRRVIRNGKILFETFRLPVHWSKEGYVVHWDRCVIY